MKKALFFIFLICTLMLIGCHGENNVEDDIHEKLTALVSSEEGISVLQKELNEHARREQSLYDEIITIPLNEEDLLEELMIDVEIELNESVEKINQIQGKLAANESYMKELVELTEDLNSIEKQASFKELQIQMNNRFQLLQLYYDTYLTTIENTAVLYELLLTEGFQSNNVYDKIQQVNDMYDVLIQLNEEINLSTSGVNEAKTAFYELMND